MDELIEQSVLSGQFDSTGRFTIDARRKGFRLAEPEEFILLLVTWASQCKARHCRIRLSRGEVVLEHDGETPSLTQLNRLISELSIGSLALAVLGAFQMKPNRLVIEVPEGQWTPRAVQRKATGSNFRFRVRLRFLQSFHKIELFLRERCRHSTLAIEINDKPLNQPLDLSKNLGSLALRSSLAPLPSFYPANQHNEREWDEPYSLILGTDRGQFERQIHGVGSHQMAHLGVAVGNLFAVDASLLKPIEDAHFASVVAGLWLDLAVTTLGQPHADVDRLADLLEEVADAFGAQGEKDWTRSVLSRRLEIARQRSEDMIPWLCRLGQLEIECAHFEDALNYWQRAYRLKRELRSAEGILLCLSQSLVWPESYREALQTVLQASRKSDKLGVFAAWLWQGEQWEEAFQCYREWLSTLTVPAPRAFCLERLVALCQRLGLRLDEENYRIQAQVYPGREA